MRRQIFRPERLSRWLLVIRPSIGLDDLAAQHLHDLPWAFRRVYVAGEPGCLEI